MPGIWRDDGSGWQLLAAEGFPDEATLHRLVREAPQLLPLAGSPRLAILGSEVLLGNGYADLIAVEPSGRLAVIEVKLARNAEARRAIVAQVLAYAAYLYGMSPAELEEQVLRRHLSAAGYGSVLEAAQANDQEGAVDPERFPANLEGCLREGQFRLVFVLDEVPTELVQLVAYLRAVSSVLLIDLITVSLYQVGDNQILLPQRVEPGSLASATAGVQGRGPSRSGGVETQGADQFEASIEAAPEENREDLGRLVGWAKRLEAEGLAKLSTYRGISGRFTLLPRLITENVGLVTVWNDRHTAYLTCWRSVFERRAPQSLTEVERVIHPAVVGQGTTLPSMVDEVLNALTVAYREAATEATPDG